MTLPKQRAPYKYVQLERENAQSAVAAGIYKSMGTVASGQNMLMYVHVNNACC